MDVQIYLHGKRNVDKVLLLRYPDAEASGN